MARCSCRASRPRSAPPMAPLASLKPAAALARARRARRAVGNGVALAGARSIRAATARTRCPTPPTRCCCPPALRDLPAAPALRPRARREAARRAQPLMATAARSTLRTGDARDIARGRRADGRGVRPALRRGVDAQPVPGRAGDAGRPADARLVDDVPAGFALTRSVAGRGRAAAARGRARRPPARRRRGAAPRA